MLPEDEHEAINMFMSFSSLRFPPILPRVQLLLLRRSKKRMEVDSVAERPKQQLYYTVFNIWLQRQLQLIYKLNWNFNQFPQQAFKRSRLLDWPENFFNYRYHLTDICRPSLHRVSLTLINPPHLCFPPQLTARRPEPVYTDPSFGRCVCVCVYGG